MIKLREPTQDNPYRTTLHPEAVPLIDTKAIGEWFGKKKEVAAAAITTITERFKDDERGLSRARTALYLTGAVGLAGVALAISLGGEEPTPAGEPIGLMFGSNETGTDVARDLDRMTGGTMSPGDFRHYQEAIHDTGRGTQPFAEAGTRLSATPMSDGTFQLEVTHDPNHDNIQD